MADPSKVTNIPLGQSKWNRMVGQEPNIQIKNRFFETNPANQVDQASFLSRPGLQAWQIVGTGPGRTTYTQPGTFEEALFVVSGNELYKIDAITGAVTFISDDILPGNGKVNMTATGTVNGTPDYLFVADGRNLFIYVENGYATGVLTGTPANSSTVTLGTTHYTFTTGSVDAGTPDGTSAHPWLVNVTTDPYLNLFNAVNGTGAAGTDYSTQLISNPAVTAIQSSTTQATFQADAVGVIGNSTVTTATGGITFASGTMTGGGNSSFNQVQTPDFVGIADVCQSQEFVVCVVAQGQELNGRFYYIQPGATTIDPLDFATAERSPDPINQCIGVGDQFWLFGTSSTEIWYFTGDDTAPVQRVQGRLFERGTWDGTGVAIKDSVIVVGRDGRVYSVDSGPNVISTPAIEEQIRKAIRTAEGRFIT